MIVLLEIIYDRVNLKKNMDIRKKNIEHSFNNVNFHGKFNFKKTI